MMEASSRRPEAELSTSSCSLSGPARRLSHAALPSDPQLRPPRPVVVPAECESPSYGRERSYTTLLIEAIERHPKFRQLLREDDGSPARAGWRKRSRRAFYVVVVLALLGVSARLHTLDVQWREAARREADAIAELVRSTEVEKASERALTRSAERRALQTSVVLNLALIGINVILAVRGVKIWHLLQRVGFEGWIRTVASHLPWTRRVTRVWGWATLPVRKAVRPLRFLTPRGWEALRAAQREAAVRAAAEEAERLAAARAAKLPWRVAYRQAYGLACFVDRKTGGLGGGIKRMLLGSPRAPALTPAPAAAPPLT